MINVVIDKSGSMNTLGKPEVIQSIIREIQLTEGIDCSFFLWGEDVRLASGTEETISIDFNGKSSIQALLNFLRNNNDSCLLLTDGFSNEDKSNLTEYLRDNSNSKLINGKSFFPENMIVSEQKKYIFNVLEVSAAIESLNY